MKNQFSVLARAAPRLASHVQAAEVTSGEAWRAYEGRGSLDRLVGGRARLRAARLAPRNEARTAEAELCGAVPRAFAREHRHMAAEVGRRTASKAEEARLECGRVSSDGGGG